jgi:hypothetical protein
MFIIGFSVCCAGTWSGLVNAQTEVAEPVPTAAPAQAPMATPPMSPAAASPTAVAAPLAAPAPAAEAKEPEPFAFADFGWMNGQSRQIDYPLAGKVLNPMFTIDVGYNYEFSNPVDHTIVGSTSSGRHNELQIMHLGLGTDLNYNGARGRLMTQLGLYSTMTPRNDASPDRGQWNLRDAYKYITEGYGGYHWNVNSGINADAGIFLSYVGLCSYYNYENWTNQASYVSSNTPWFFNGVRIQWFPTDKLKIEPWIINGWQSYGEFNNMPGFGFQIAYRPNGAVALVVSGYYGKDTMGQLETATDFTPTTACSSSTWKRPSSFLTKAAFSLTADAGCEDGDGVKCAGGDSNRRHRSTSWVRCSTTGCGSTTTCSVSQLVGA